MDLKSGIDKFGLNPEDINDLYDEDKAAATGDAPVAAAVQTEDETDFVFESLERNGVLIENITQWNY